MRKKGTKMYGDLNDCYGQALNREIEEANAMEQKSIQQALIESDRYYAEQAMQYDVEEGENENE